MQGIYDWNINFNRLKVINSNAEIIGIVSDERTIKKLNCKKTLKHLKKHFLNGFL